MSEKGSNTTYGGSSSSASGMVTVQPLMRTEAEQQQINQIRLESEMDKQRMLALVDQRHQDFANFVAGQMQQADQRQPHVTYNVYSGGSNPPAPPPAPLALADTKPSQQIQALERKLEEERQQSQLRLHEATASAKQTVNQQMLEMKGEVLRAQDMARAVAAASTDEIRANRGRQAWGEQFALELRDARSQVASLQANNQAFFEQQVRNEVAKAERINAAARSAPPPEKRKKAAKLEQAATSSGPPPPPAPPGGGKVTLPAILFKALRVTSRPAHRSQALARR